MIKGVNKRVLEINDPKSIYFEKAVLYIKPNMSCFSKKLARREADEIIRELSPKTPKIVLYGKFIGALITVFSLAAITVMLFVSKFM